VAWLRGAECHLTDMSEFRWLADTYGVSPDCIEITIRG